MAIKATKKEKKRVGHWVSKKGVGKNLVLVDKEAANLKKGEERTSREGRERRKKKKEKREKKIEKNRI